MPTLKSGLGPFVHTTYTTHRLMWHVVVALLPIGCVGIVLFGVSALKVIVISIGATWIADLFGRKANGQPMSLTDASPIITGLLLAYMLPPWVPWYVPVVGAVYAVLIGKQLFGGLGYNLFNPALVGRVLLQWTYPAWLNPTHVPPPVDAITAASPLDTTSAAHQARLADLVIGNHEGSIGETSAVIILLCGAYLIYRCAIDWKAPAFCLLAVFTSALFLPAPQKFAGHAPYLVHNPLYHVLAGGTMLAAFFLVTDPVTTPLTGVGRVIFAMGVGVITVLIRYYGVYAEGIAYAILIMNALTPLINRLLHPTPVGHPFHGTSALSVAAKRALDSPAHSAPRRPPS